MGAEQFESVVKGKTADEAFRKAVESAQYDYGHAGYTGTIAEKDDYVEFKVPDGMSVERFIKLVSDDNSLDKEDLTDKAKKIIEKARQVYDDKWGPAVAIELEPGEWLFCGLASS